MLRSTWTETGLSGANAALTLTKVAGGVGKIHYITSIEAVLLGADATADAKVELKSAATVKWSEAFGSGAKRGARIGIVFAAPLEMGVNEAATLVADAAGAGATVRLNLAGYTA